MDMGTGKTDKLGAAIAALPYRSPSAGFRARVLAAVAAEAAARRRLDWAVKALAALTVSWAGLVGLLSAGLAGRLAVDYGPLALEPGGAALAAKLMGAKALLLAGKAATAVSLAREAGAAALTWLPPVHEIALAALAGALLLKFAAAPRQAAQKI